MNQGTLHRLAAFTNDPRGGNPAGVWIGNSMPDADAMLHIAREVGYSETAFVEPAAGRRRVIRYFSPEAEVPFCGHATIATGVQLGNDDGPGDYVLETAAGEVMVQVDSRGDVSKAALTSVATQYKKLSDPRLTEYLELFGWRQLDLDLEIPPAVAYAGAWHLVIALTERSVLAQLDYPFDALKAKMLEDDITTIQVVWRENNGCFHARNPFPVGGVVEDPATGAAAAALGGYLRDAELVATPAQFEILQGEDMGRPSRLSVDVPVTGGIRVAGFAVPIQLHG